MHFGIDVREFFTGDLTLRRLNVLVRRLIGMHGRSALSEAMLGEQASWSNIEYILADLRDSIEAGNYLFLSAHRDDKYTMPEFQPYPRPGLDVQSVNYSPEPEWATAQDIAELFRMAHGS